LNCWRHPLTCRTAAAINLRLIGRFSLLVQKSGVAQGECWRFKGHNFMRKALVFVPFCIVFLQMLSGCASVFSTGDQPGDLKVQIVGQHADTIEVYFHNQGIDLDQFHRQTYAATENLQFGDNVVLAPKNPSGTFAVRYGYNRDHVTVYGFRKDRIDFLHKDLPLDPGYAACLTWITTQILKVQYGPCHSKEMVVRFNGNADQAWTILFPNP
jgi:hypothetical protein